MLCCCWRKNSRKNNSLNSPFTIFGGGGPNPPDDDDDPSDPGDHESGPDSEYYAPAESTDACIVVHYLFQRARTDSTILWAGICSRDMTAGELLRRIKIIPSSLLGKSCVIDPKPAPKAEPAPKMKPPPPSLAAGKGPPRRSAPAVHTGSAHTAKRPRETGGGSTGSVQIPGHYFGKARTKESPVQPSEPPMGGAGGSARRRAQSRIRRRRRVPRP